VKEFFSGDLIEGKYRVKHLLGEGGMSRVYLVEDVHTFHRWAMKVTKPPGELGSTSQEAYNKFLKEISILTTIKHPNLPALEDYFASGDHYVIIEEYIEGESLGAFMERKLPGEPEVVRWALTLCSVLDLLHRNGIVFRDLKPANIMRRPDGEVKLIDFDIARHYKEGKLQDTMLLGTPGYAAPETYGKAQSDERSDIFSLGATIHHLMSGMDPQDDPFHFQPLGQLRMGVNPALQAIVDTCLKMKPSERYQTIEDVALALEGLRNMKNTTQPGGLSSHPCTGSLPALDFLPSHWVDSLSDMAIFVDNTVARFTGKPPAHPPVLKSLLTGPPSVKTRKVTNWNPYAGSSFDVYQDTYLYYPGKMTGVSLGISSPKIRPGHLMVVNLFFSLSYRNFGSYIPRPLELSFHFVMPLDQNYTEGCGSLAEIPGAVIEYEVSTPNCWSGDASGTVIQVVHDRSFVRVLMKWRPQQGLPPLMYDIARPWRGPRLLVHAECSDYSWQYTKGFVIY